MDAYHIVLRIVHILAGVFWAGSSILFIFFIEPTSKELGETGERFMSHLIVQKKMPIVITITAGLTIVAGVLLYWRVSGGFQPAWITSPSGLTFTIGGLAAIVAFAMGVIGIKPAVDRMGVISAEVAASGGGPTEAQIREVAALEQRLQNVGRFDLVLITIAVISMAVARYVG